MLKFVLLTLTLTAQDEVRLTLSDMASLEDCQASKAQVSGILAQAGVKSVAALCGESDLRLTPFTHGAAPEEEIHRYRVEIAPDDSFAVTPLSGTDTCTPSGSGSGPGVYCTRSAQSVVVQ